ncbi:MAG TPA: restriction endonuclease subunit S [Thermoanaerobaculia bacterium]|nr:restriction endonuclease subunit S [Thermoanaerobaculia bacterium]
MISETPVLPQPWRSVKLDELCTLVRGASPRPKGDPRYFGGPIPWISIADLSREEGKFLTRTKEGVTAAGAKLSRLLSEGTLIVSNSATICIPKILGVAGCIHDGFVALTELSPKVDIHYLYHFFNAIRDEIRAKNTQGVTQVNLNTTIFKGMDVPLPPLKEQRRIAEVLDRAEALRAKRRAALAQLDILTQAIFLDLFGDPTTNPKGWGTQPLASLVRSDDTINYGVVQPGDHVEDGIPLVRVGNLLEGRVNHSSLKRIAPMIEASYKRSRLRGHEVLVSCVGSIGVVALADETVKGFNIARAVARIPLMDTASRVFMAAYLATNFVQNYFTTELRTVSQPTLNIKQLSETPVVLPPAELQQEFCHRVSAVDKLRIGHRASLVELDGLFATLQHRAFRGEL